MAHSEGASGGGARGLKLSRVLSRRGDLHSGSQRARGRRTDSRVASLGPAGAGRQGTKEGFLRVVSLDGRSWPTQDDVTAVLRSGLDDDSDESGKRRLTEALQGPRRGPCVSRRSSPPRRSVSTRPSRAPDREVDAEDPPGSPFVSSDRPPRNAVSRFAPKASEKRGRAPSR